MTNSLILEKMTVFIQLGKPQSEFPYEMTPELRKSWEQLASQIKLIEQSGGIVEIISEIQDVEVPNPV